PNETTDHLAKQALSSIPTSLDLLAYLPKILINRIFKSIYYTYQEFARSDTSNSYSWLTSSINYSYFPDRYSEVQLRRFRLGRGLTRVYAQRFLRFNTDLCNCQILLSVDDAAHFFLHCKFFAQERR